jgi:hypothetical protein
MKLSFVSGIKTRGKRFEEINSIFAMFHLLMVDLEGDPGGRR